MTLRGDCYELCFSRVRNRDHRRPRASVGTASAAACRRNRDRRDWCADRGLRRRQRSVQHYDYDNDNNNDNGYIVGHGPRDAAKRQDRQTPLVSPHRPFRWPSREDCFPITRSGGLLAPLGTGGQEHRQDVRSTATSSWSACRESRNRATEVRVTLSSSRRQCRGR